MAASPARRVAFAVVRRVFEQGAFADRALHAEARDLGARDRALATALAYGTVQRARTLDRLIAQLAERDPVTLDPPVHAALRLGLLQLLLLDGIAEHAAVHESVELVKRGPGRGGAGLVNAVLRRAAREGRAILDELDDDTPQHAAILHSTPDWLAELWWQELGPQDAREMLRTINAPAENVVRVNTLKGEDPPLPVSWHGVPELPEARILEEPFDVFGSEAWALGQITPQSRASMLVAGSLGPQAGERILDLCAAPGGKTTHLAALSGDAAQIVAVEVHPGRAAALERTCRRMGADSVIVENVDGRSFADAAGFDRVLVDPPCSGLGTLQSRPDLRWQERRGRIGALTEGQRALLEAGAAALRPGGTLVYSVCTISRAEGVELIDRFLAERTGFVLRETRQLLPSRDGTDGFFIARLTRT